MDEQQVVHLVRGDADRRRARRLLLGWRRRAGEGRRLGLPLGGQQRLGLLASERGRQAAGRLRALADGAHRARHDLARWAAPAARAERLVEQGRQVLRPAVLDAIDVQKSCPASLVRSRRLIHAAACFRCADCRASTSTALSRCSGWKRTILASRLALLRAHGLVRSAIISSGRRCA